MFAHTDLGFDKAESGAQSGSSPEVAHAETENVAAIEAGQVVPIVVRTGRNIPIVESGM